MNEIFNDKNSICFGHRTTKRDSIWLIHCNNMKFCSFTKLCKTCIFGCQFWIFHLVHIDWQQEIFSRTLRQKNLKTYDTNSLMILCLTWETSNKIIVRRFFDFTKRKKLSKKRNNKTNKPKKTDNGNERVWGNFVSSLEFLLYCLLAEVTIFTG